MSKVWICLFAAGRVLAADHFTALRNVTVISPERTEPLAHAFVLLKNDRIEEVGTGEGKFPKGTEIVDGKGGFLIPGLIDSHVHLVSPPGMSLGQRKKYAMMVGKYETQLPRSYLYYGYTTVIDLAVVEPGPLRGFRHAPYAPDLFDCGGPLAFANGYPMSYIDAAFRFDRFPNFIYDVRQKDKIPKKYAAKDHTPAAAVARVKASGAVCVKTHYEPGFDKKKTLPTPTLETLTEIARESRRAGLPLLIHANSLEAQKFAVAAGPSIFAHGLWNWDKHTGEKGLPAPVRETLDAIVEKNVGYQPTFQVVGGLKAMYDPKYLQMPQVRKVIPAEMLAWFQSKEGQWFPESILEEFGETPQTIVPKHENILSQLERTVAYLDGKNARLLFGTDTPSAPTYGNLPGLNGYLEMQHWYRAKVAPLRTLRAATLSNAEAFGLEKEYGTVSAGKKANLVLLAQSPLDSVEAYDAIVSVVLHGKVLAREQFAAP